MFPRLVGLQRDTRWRASGRAVGDVEPPVVLGAFHKSASDEAVGEMGVTVGAETVRGIQIAVGSAVDSVGSAFVVEADHVFFLQEAAGEISIQPFTGLPLAVKVRDRAEASLRTLGVGSSRMMQ